jgi:hypothetical protein
MSYNLFCLLIMVRLSAVWLVWLSQSIKLLHLLGLPSLAAGAVGALVYALIGPFISLYRPDTAPDPHPAQLPTASSYLFSGVIMTWQLFQAGLSVVWFYKHIAYKVFVLVLSREPTDLQVVMGCVGIYSTFLSTYCFCYLPDMTALRG